MNIWTSRIRSAFGLWVAVALATTLLAPTAAAAGYEVQSVTSWKQNAAPMGWSASLNRVIYNSRGADGMFDASSAKPDGSGAQCVTCALPSFPGVGAATQRGVSDVSPDGNYMLLEVERGDHVGQVGDTIAEPGKGAYNDVWLATTDGSKAWPLTDINATGQQVIGTMWARFDRTGNRLVWAEMYAPAILNLGYWRLKVADIVWNNGVPGLANVKTIEPQTNHFYEPYGFSPDGSHIIFASDLGMSFWWDSQIYSIATDGSDLKRLSPDDAPEGFFTNYNEFAFYLPHGDQIIYGRTRDATNAGVDYWLMNPDGSGQQRLTFLNEPWSTEYRGYTVVGGLAFDPNNPNRFIADVTPDMSAHQLDAVMITLNDSPSGGGLTGQYFADANFGKQVLTRTENPSNGFKWDGSPAPGVPASGYSVRWSGSISGTTTGDYTYCVIADDGARLWVADKLVADASNSTGKRVCATVPQTAGTAVAIRLDYWNYWGLGYVQLSRIAPGSAATDGSPGVPGGGGLIPPTDLTPPAAGAPVPSGQPPTPFTSTPGRPATSKAGVRPNSRKHNKRRPHASVKHTWQRTRTAGDRPARVVAARHK